MRIYSRTIVAFTGRLEARARDILAREMGLSVGRKMFSFGGYSHRLRVVCFEDERPGGNLGYFDPDSYDIGINRSLMYRAGEEFIDNILRHELAHFITFLQFGTDVPDHGRLYHKVCRKFGWGPEVFRAKASDARVRSSLRQAVQDRKGEQRLLLRVQKLLALGSSSNGHEAELATLKANELLIKYNLNATSDSSEEEEFCVRVVAFSKRRNETLRVLSHILRNFFVVPVYSYGEKGVSLEVLGSRLNVELADYVAKFLQGEFVRLWEEAKRADPRLKGRVAKNSFLRGVAHGLSDKLQNSRKKSASARELVVLDRSLEEGMALVYPNSVTSSSASVQHCSQSAAAGQSAGAGISIRPGLKRSGGGTRLLSAR